MPEYSTCRLYSIRYTDSSTRLHLVKSFFTIAKLSSFVFNYRYFSIPLYITWPFGLLWLIDKMAIRKNTPSPQVASPKTTVHFS